MAYEKRWGEKRWAGMRWEELRWDEGCSVKCGARRVQCEVWSVKCEVWSVKCEVWSVECEVWSVECKECSVKCGVWSAKWSFKCDMWNRTSLSQSARTHGLGWRTAHASSIDEKGLIYIFKATSAPPRAGTTGIYIYIPCVYNIFISNHTKSTWNTIEVHKFHKFTCLYIPSHYPVHLFSFLAGFPVREILTTNRTSSAKINTCDSRWQPIFKRNHDEAIKPIWDIVETMALTSW